MIAMTTRSSMRVKPLLFILFHLLSFWIFAEKKELGHLNAPAL
jgi:hypothetical protein